MSVQTSLSTIAALQAPDSPFAAPRPPPPPTVPAGGWRVLHTLPGRNWGGMEERTLEQIRWLHDHGHSAWLATPKDGEAFRQAEARGLPAVAMDFDRPWLPATLSALRRFVRDNRIDLIDAHVTRDAKAAIACLPLCAVVRSRHTDHPLTPSLSRRLQWRLGCDHVITVAGTTRRHLLSIGLATPDRSSWIGGWANDPFFTLADPAAAGARVRRELGLTDDETVVLSLAMLRPDKGQPHLLAAVAALRARGVKIICLLAGATTAETAPYEAELRAQAVKLGIADCVRFLGYRHDVPELMRAADMVVVASLIEGQPRAAVQAFASARPVVATRVGGVPDIVEDGVTGLLVPPGNADSLADSIAKLAGDPAFAARLGANARRMAETSMRIDARMGETLAAYWIARRHARRRLFPRLSLG